METLQKNTARSYSSLLAWRTDKALNQKDAAASLDLTQSIYSKYERRDTYPLPARAKVISAKTRVPFDVLRGW